MELALSVIGSLAMERENKRALGLKGKQLITIIHTVYVYSTLTSLTTTITHPESGGCETVVRMLSLPQHHRHQHVGSNGLRAVANLAAEFEANCRRLEAVGAPREVRTRTQAVSFCGGRECWFSS